MDTLDTDGSANESRTKRSISRKCKFVFKVLIAIALIVPSNAAESIDFDNADTSWFTDATVYSVPANQTGYNNTVPLLKIHGLKAIDADDEIRVKPTFSTTDCQNNKPELKIVNNIYAASQGSGSNSDVIVALKHFDFGPNVNAYLCIKSKYENDFQHMGANSKFST